MACFGIEHALVHVHVDDLGAVFDLLPRNLYAPRCNRPLRSACGRSRGARNVAALTDIDEQIVGSDVGRLEPGEPASGFGSSGTSRGGESASSTASLIARNVIRASCRSNRRSD